MAPYLLHLKNFKLAIRFRARSLLFAFRRHWRRELWWNWWALLVQFHLDEGVGLNEIDCMGRGGGFDWKGKVENIYSRFYVMWV